MVERIVHGGRLVECGHGSGLSESAGLSDDRLPVEEIDPAIRELVLRMNDVAGVRTLWSCQGHWRARLRPYVVFTAPASLVYHVSKYLDARNELTYAWWIRGDWHHARSGAYWRWTLEPNDWRLEPGGRHLLFRKALDRDFSLIGDAFVRLGSAEPGCANIERGAGAAQRGRYYF
jgi:hypothetical protein